MYGRFSKVVRKSLKQKNTWIEHCEKKKSEQFNLFFII